MRVKLHPAQRSIIDDTHRFKVIVAGRRFGKSVLARMWLLDQALRNPGKLFTITAPTYQQGKDIHFMQGYKKEIPSSWIDKWNDSELKINLKNGSIIQIKTAEKPDSLRGIKQGAGVIDEISSIRGWDYFWQECYRPTLTDYSAPALFIGTPKGYDHFYDLFMTDNTNWESFQFTTYDNPHIPEDEIDEAKSILTEDAFAQEYLAQFKKYTGLVYKEFDRTIHVKELPDFEPVFYIRGLDRGFRNPTASPLIAVNKDDVWYQIDEIYESGLTNPPLAKKLDSMCSGYSIEFSTMDSAQASDIQDLSDLGQDFIPVSKLSGESNQNYVRYKIQKFAQRLKQADDGSVGYYCHPRNENTIMEFETYRWKEKKANINQDMNEPEEPEKANDHMMDALADLNAMYIHHYRPTIKKPWDDKIPGTYIPPARQTVDSDDFINAPGVEW